MKTLVAYYSYSGVTARVAAVLAEALAADVIRIEDASRPSWLKALVAGSFAALRGKAWPVKPFRADWSGYDRLFIGSPVWAGRPAPAVLAALEQAAFVGKPVVLFVTQASGGQESALKAMADKVAARGGTVDSTFFLQAGKGAASELAAKAREIAGRYRAS